MNFFLTNFFSLLGRYQLYIIAKRKANNCFKTEAVIQRFSGKKEFLKISKNLQENPCAKVSFSIKLQTWRTPLVAASGEIKLKSLKKENFSSAFFDYASYHGLTLHWDKIVVKFNVHRKTFVILFILQFKLWNI